MDEVRIMCWIARTPCLWVGGLPSIQTKVLPIPRRLTLAPCLWQGEALYVPFAFLHPAFAHPLPLSLQQVKRWARQGREMRLSQRRVDADDSSISGQSHEGQEDEEEYEDLADFIVASEGDEEQQDDFPVRCVCGATAPGRDAEYVASTALQPNHDSPNPLLCFSSEHDIPPIHPFRPICIFSLGYGV